MFSGIDNRKVGVAVCAVWSLATVVSASIIFASWSQTEFTAVERDKNWNGLNLYLRELGFTDFEVSDDAFPEQTTKFASYAYRENVHTICEIGFNAGHSAINWLVANPYASVISFDHGNLPFTVPASDWIKEKYPGRLELVIGDPASQIPALHAERPDLVCDIIHIDAGHSDTVQEDSSAYLHAMVQLSAKENVLLMDNTVCDMPWCAGTEAALDAAAEEGIVYNYESYSFYSQGKRLRGFSVGRYQV